MKHKDIHSILERYRQGTATDEDRAFLENWYLWKDDGAPSSLPYTAPELLEDTEEVWSRLNRRGAIRKRRIYQGAAAAILLMIGLGLWWQVPTNTKSDLNMEEIVAYSDAEPTITLPDGSVIPLGMEHSGIQMGSAVHYEDGSPVHGIAEAGHSQELLIQVPTGRTYQITLSDQTRVWLNAGSSLRYPSVFKGDKRIVVLEGEAYFEVSPQYQEGHSGRKRKEFIVETDKQVIEVLGTHFNVQAYRGARQRTTLLEGKVQLTSPGIGPYTTLQPGQEAVVENQSIVVKAADGGASVFWISGLFSFDNKSFKEIMQEVGLWYDLEIVYEGNIPTETFFGQAYRSDNLGTVLRLLESAKIQYRVTNDRKLIIKNEK